MDRIAYRCLARIFFATLAVALLPAVGWAGSASDMLTRFRDEAPPAWARLDAAEDHVETSGVLTSNIANAGPRRFHYATGGGCQLFEYEQEGAELGKVYCMSPDRSFLLGRNAPGSPWVITSLGTPDDRIRDLINKHYTIQEKTATHGAFGIRLSELVTKPSFKLKDVRPTTRDGRELARVDFDYEFNMPGKTEKLTSECSMLLRPDGLWSVREIQSKGPGANQSLVTLEYGEDESGLPSLRHYRVESKFMAGNNVPGSMLQDDVFDRYTHRGSPPSAFTMAAFGLPELGHKPVAAAGPRPELWLLGMAVAFGVAAAVFRLRRVRPGVVPA